MKRDAAQILRNLDNTLTTANQGLQDFTSSPGRRLSGLRNFVTFARAVSHVLQTFRSVDPGFDDWYRPFQDDMKDSTRARRFLDLRNELLKEGSMNGVGVAVHFDNFNTAMLEPLMRNPPPGAKGFFIGDPEGGSGWDVSVDEGLPTEKYYVELPPAARANVRIQIVDFKSDEGKRALLYDAQQHYRFLEDLVAKAHERYDVVPPATGEPT